MRREEVIIPNRCTSDIFLNRLCKTDPSKTIRNTFGINKGDANARVEDEIEDQSVDPMYKVKLGIVYPNHDPNQPWKDMVPILVMKFKDHEVMKIMVANYGVANGYQLWYKRNDFKSLLVLCGRNVAEGRRASKIGRKGIKETAPKGNYKQKVTEGKGKKKVAEGKGKKNIVGGSKVAEGKNKWTKQGIKMVNLPSKEKAYEKIKVTKGSKIADGNNKWTKQEIKMAKSLSKNGTKTTNSFNYVREIVNNPKISYKDLQAAIKEKFLISVSLGQVRMEKQRALYDNEGWLIKHCGKLWDYIDQLLKTNPGLNVKLDVDKGSGGKTYFKRCCRLRGLEKLQKRKTSGYNLGDDLNLNRGANVTILSDGHKVLCLGDYKALCEVFTTSTSRGKPIITMLEDIRIYLIKRFWEVYPSDYREFEVRKLMKEYEAMEKGNVNSNTAKYKHHEMIVESKEEFVEETEEEIEEEEEEGGPEHFDTFPTMKELSETSALKRIRMDTSTSGSGKHEEANVQEEEPTNADPGHNE
nr:calcium/proton exchanger [Tanacetum cinerariifolium]